MDTLSPEKMRKIFRINYRAFICATVLVIASLQGCALRTADVFRDQNMDFGSVKTVAIMPLANYSRDILAGDRVRDVFTTALLASGAVYVVPTGELARGISSAGVINPTTPSVDEVIKLCRILKTDAVITGSIREYGELRSAAAVADVVSLSMQLIEGQAGRIVWAAGSTEGGVGIKDRLLGGGGKPLNVTTEKAVHDIIDKLFY